MFAVPGWSVSAASLKTQIDSKALESVKSQKTNRLNGDGPEKKSKKRKRTKNVEVTSENLSELWQKHFETSNRGNAKGESHTKEGGAKKKRNRNKEDVETRSGEAGSDAFEGFSDENSTPDVDRHGNETQLASETKNPQTNRQTAAREDETRQKDSKALKDESKAKFEQRKAEAAKKRKERAQQQANGTLPPSRPAPESKTDVAPPKGPPTIIEQSPSHLPPTTPKDHGTRKESKAEKRKNRRLQQVAQTTSPNLPAPPTTTSNRKAPTKLTPLQAQMAAKLTSARFRHLNQTLYTTPSTSALELFIKTPNAYESYHAGFRAQVAVWPSNPVNRFIEDVKSRGKVIVLGQKKMWREQKRGKGKGKAEVDGGDDVNVGKPKPDPLPRGREGICRIVDLGCGDATLAASLSGVRKALKLEIQSFDLAKGDSPNASLITVADSTDLTKVGVKDGSVDVAVCCLSLMGTNWVGVVDECRRVVRGGGEVWIAEIKSRFGRPVKKGMKIGEKKVGVKGGGKKRKRDGEEDEEGDGDAVALEELEEVKPAADKTDVSAFVEVFGKRGFVLKGEPDLGNKMFVKMRFVRVLKQGGDAGGDRRDWGVGKQGKTKFLGEEKGDKIDESKVLKPCVYKTR